MSESPRSKLLDIYCESTLVANLFACVITTFLDAPKDMLMFLVSTPLPHTFPSPLSELLQAFFKLFILLLLLFGCPPLPLRIQGLWRTPFLPREVLHLTT